MGKKLPRFNMQEGELSFPPWMAGQKGWGNIHAPVVNQQDASQQWPVGTKWIEGNRVFRYCYAGSAIAIPQRGVANASPHLEGTCLGNSVAGAYTLDLPPACADFPAYTITTENAYAGGWVWVMGSSGNPAQHEFHRIISNDATTGVYVRVTLATPFINSTTTPWITSYRNIYANCQQGYPNIPTGTQTIVCMTAGGMVVTSGYYFWGQTWGESWCTAHDVTPGLVGHHRELIFKQGGTIAVRHEFDPTTYSYQRAGYVLTDTVNTGDMMFMMQLDR